jgi:hypothetical protein
MNIINHIKRYKLSYIILLLGVVFWIDILLLIYAENVENGKLFLMLGAFILFIYSSVSILSLIEGIMKWKIMRWRGVLPFGLSIIIFLGIHSISTVIHSRDFKRNFQDYNQVVEQIQSGKITITQERTYISIPESFPAYEIVAYKLDTDRFMVKFERTHQRDSFGYLYISQGKIDNKRYELKIIQQLRPNWYSYSD